MATWKDAVQVDVIMQLLDSGKQVDEMTEKRASLLAPQQSLLTRERSSVLVASLCLCLLTRERSSVLVALCLDNQDLVSTPKFSTLCQEM